MKVDIPRLVIASPFSGSGKSTITSGLMAFLSRSRVVQGFKIGPDYIDPGYHTHATGRISRNLDTWMIPEEKVIKSFARALTGADLALIEGVMGLYDGYDSFSETGSTAQAAKLLGSPVILVMDVSKMARSAAALAQGYKQFDPGLNLAGVICNRVGSSYHARIVREAIEVSGIPVLGCIPRSEELVIPERHLGLKLAEERLNEVNRLLDTCSRIFEENLDLQHLLEIAGNAPPLEVNLPPSPAFTGDRIRIATARDEAFCFYYEENFDLLRKAGADIVFFSPLKEKELPTDVAGIYLGGGYPEIYASQLAANTSMKQAIKNAAEKNIPLYAECGGLMFLSEYLLDLQGHKFEMLGILPGTTQMVPKLSMGYREITTLKDTCLLPQGMGARGHEFHYSHWLRSENQDRFAYSAKGRFSQKPFQEGFAHGNLLASYVHLHFGSNEDLAKNFVRCCRDWKTEKVGC